MWHFGYNALCPFVCLDTILPDIPNCLVITIVDIITQLDHSEKRTLESIWIRRVCVAFVIATGAGVGGRWATD